MANFDSVNVSVAEMIAAVAEAKGVKNSVLAFIATIEPRLQAAVTAALAADNASDDATATAVAAAIATSMAEVRADSAELAAAIVANPAPTV